MAARQADVAQALQSGGVTVYNLKVEETGDTVALYGTVASEDQKQRAERVVMDTLHVKVANYITPQQQSTAQPPDSDVSSWRATAEPASAATSGGQKYVVKSGDTLRKIAQHFYGDEMQWHRIRDANRDKLPNPDKIGVGMELMIPGA